MSDHKPDRLSVDEEAQLASLEPRFLAALAAREARRLDDAEDELRAILAIEPRLAEPHIELARVLADTDRLHEAEEHAREGVALLDNPGPWTDEIPENVLRGLAHALLAEVLRRRADEDDVIFGDPAVFQALVRESREHFERAAAIDPSDEYSSYHAFFMGVGQKAPEGLEIADGEADADEVEESDA